MVSQHIEKTRFFALLRITAKVKGFMTHYTSLIFDKIQAILVPTIFYVMNLQII